MAYPIEDVIELKELRIGSILLYKGELHFVSMLSMDIDDEYQDMIGVTPLGKQSGEKADWNRTDLKRIPLTEEWLTNLGFSRDNHGFVLSDKMSLSFSITKDNKFLPCWLDLPFVPWCL